MRFMQWVPAAEMKPVVGKYYLVWTNSAEWCDPHIICWTAMLLERYMKSEVVCERLLFVAEVTDPTVAPTSTDHLAVPCSCGHRACKSWHVYPEATVQCVSFDERQAKAVAALLNEL